MSYISGGGGGGSSNPASPSVVTSGLLAQYRILPTETIGALVDYSGNSNNATGTVGTAPTIISVTGGAQFAGNGAVSLPAALNSAQTIMIFASYHVNDYATIVPPLVQTFMSPILGNDTTFVNGLGKICGIVMHGGQGVVGDSYGNGSYGGRQLRSVIGQSSPAYASSTVGVFEGVGSMALVQSATDLFYINGIAQRYFQTGSSLGKQTAGNYQLGGCASGVGFQAVPTYMVGQIYYALFYSRALSAAEIAQNHQAIASELASRGVTVQNSGPLINTGLFGIAGYPDVNPQVVFRGDSITQGQNSPTWFPLVTPAGVGGIHLQLNNQGLPGDGIASLVAPYTPMETDNFYRRGGTANAIFAFLGVNDGTNALYRSGFMRDFCAERKQIGWKAIAGTVTSNTNESAVGGSSMFNETIRQEWKSYADGLCDWAACPNIGATGANANTSYFTTNIHPTGLANQYIIAPLVTRLIDRIFGNNNWSSAYTASVNSGPTFVQGYNFGGGTGLAIQKTFAMDNQPGSTLFVAADGYQGTALSVTDSNNNNWQLLHTQRNTNAIWYAQNVKGGLNTVTLNYGSTNSYLRGIIAEYAGVSKTTAPLVANAQGSSTALNSGNITTVTNNSLVVGIGMFTTGGGTYTPGVSFTQDVNAGSTTLEYFEHLVQAVAGAIAATATLSASATWDMTAVGLAPDTGAVYPMQDRDVYLKADPTNGSLTVVLPPATGITGQRVKIKNVQTTGANTVTIIPTSIGITSVVANGTTAVFTVPNVTGFIAGQKITVQGCTTSSLNATYTITSVTVSGGGPTGTVTVASTTTVTETEPSTASMGCEYIDNAVSVALANNTTLVLESVLNPNASIRGCNWISVTD